MKSGASDPFAEDGSEDVDESEDADASEGVDVSEDVDVSEGVDANGVDAVEDESRSVEETAEELAEDAVDEIEEDEIGEGDGSDGRIDRSEIPWLLRRDVVKDDRPHVHQLFVREDTDAEARRAESRLEERLDTDVYRLDAREAMYLVGMRHLDEVAELLEEWGYNF